MDEVFFSKLLSQITNFIYLAHLTSLKISLQFKLRLFSTPNPSFYMILKPENKLNNLSRKTKNVHSYLTPNAFGKVKSRRLSLEGNVARMEEDSSALRISTGKPTRKRPLGRPRNRWEDNIRMNHKEIGMNTRNCVDSTLDRDYYWGAHVNAELNLQVP